MDDLELGAIGNCSFSALLNSRGSIVWCCLPSFDGDPIFHALLGGPEGAENEGRFEIELEGLRATSQEYVPNTAVLKTVLQGETGSIQIVDCAPRFYRRDKTFSPRVLVRRILPLSGSPRIRVLVRPRFNFGADAPHRMAGADYIRYASEDMALRLVTNAPIDRIEGEDWLSVNEPLEFLFGPEKLLTNGFFQSAKSLQERTIHYWRGWARRLALPLEWQEVVIRAAITLKLCTYEETGAIVAAMTTSIPEAPNSGRNWDYRYCWIRDAYFVIRALNSLAAVRPMENYFRWLMKVIPSQGEGHVQPLYTIGFESSVPEREVTSLQGYRGMGPVRIGNQAAEHFQHDAYGNVILGSAQAFFDRRLLNQPGLPEFRRLQGLGEQAYRLHDKPDAGIWEYRTRSQVHTSSSVLCWAACDRLAHIAAHLGEAARVKVWRRRAAEIRRKILEMAWSDPRQAFVDSFGGNNLDASVLLMSEVGFINPNDPRFVSTVEQLDKYLGRGPYMMRYESEDDFGLPVTAFNICSFWRLDALHRIGRTEQAREIFEALLGGRTKLGLLSEDTDPTTKELWGNFPQTYSMVGIINSAMRLSRPWESVI